MAPEMLLDGEFDNRADIWSLGVILFELLTNTLPFYHSDRSKLKTMITKYEINFAYISQNLGLSPSAIDLL